MERTPSWLYASNRCTQREAEWSRDQPAVIHLWYGPPVGLVHPVSTLSEGVIIIGLG